MCAWRRETLTARVCFIRITSLVVPALPPIYNCPKCGEVVLRFQDSKRLSEDAIAIDRKKQQLLSADEIRAIRDRFNLTQADLARLLRLGANTVSRWESGRNTDGSDGHLAPTHPRSAWKYRLPPRPRGLSETSCTRSTRNLAWRSTVKR